MQNLLNICIECEIIKGTGTNSSGQVESHAWNAVKLYDKWYYVDCTWDDPIILGNGRIFSNVKYKYFLKGTDSFKDDHIVDTKFSEAGRDFAYPEVSKEDY